MADDKLAAAVREAEALIAALAGQYQPPVVRDLVNAAVDLLAALSAEGGATAPQPTPEPVSHAYKLPPSIEEAAEDVVRGDWWGHYCPCCGSTFKHGPECLIGRLANALASARGARGGE